MCSNGPTLITPALLTSTSSRPRSAIDVLDDAGALAAFGEIADQHRDADAAPFEIGARGVELGRRRAPRS